MDTNWLNPGGKGTVQANPYPQYSREWYVYNNYADYGYQPSKAEVSAAVSNWSNQSSGGAAGWIAQQQLINEQKQKAEQAPIEEQKRLDALVPQYQGTIQDTFNELLKRGATQADIEHFGREMASGNLDAYTLRQFVQSMPEYQTAQDKAMREGLATELQGYDTKFFDQNKDSIISRYASAGRLGSSALDYALTDMLGKIADKRGEWLANLSAQQYGGNKDTARADYTASMNKMLGEEAYTRQQKDALTQRNWDMNDYYTQANDYQRWLEQSQRKPNWMDYTAFGLNAAKSASETYRNLQGSSGGLWGGK